MTCTTVENKKISDLWNNNDEQIEIYDMNSGMQLFRIRSKKEKVKGGKWYIRNYIEKGPLLSELTSIKR